MIHTVAECDFCTNTVEVETGPFGLNEVDLQHLALDLAAIAPDWRVIFTGSQEPTVICPSCLPQLEIVVAAIDAGITSVLERQRGM